MLPKSLYYHCIHLKITLWDLYNFILKPWSELLIFLDEYRLSRLHLIEAVILFGVAIKLCLVISWWVGEGGLEGWGNIYLEIFCADKGSDEWEIWWQFLGSNDLIYQPVMSMFSWIIIIQFFPKSGRFPPQISCLLELLLDHGIW